MRPFKTFQWKKEAGNREAKLGLVQPGGCPLPLITGHLGSGSLTWGTSGRKPVKNKSSLTNATLLTKLSLEHSWPAQVQSLLDFPSKPPGCCLITHESNGQDWTWRPEACVSISDRISCLMINILTSLCLPFFSAISCLCKTKSLRGRNAFLLYRAQRTKVLVSFGVCRCYGEMNNSCIRIYGYLVFL